MIFGEVLWILVNVYLVNMGECLILVDVGILEVLGLIMGKLLFVLVVVGVMVD